MLLLQVLYILEHTARSIVAEIDKLCFQIWKLPIEDLVPYGFFPPFCFVSHHNNMCALLVYNLQCLINHAYSVEWIHKTLASLIGVILRKWRNSSFDSLVWHDSVSLNWLESQAASQEIHRWTIVFGYLPEHMSLRGGTFFWALKCSVSSQSCVKTSIIVCSFEHGQHILVVSLPEGSHFVK